MYHLLPTTISDNLNIHLNLMDKLFCQIEWIFDALIDFSRSLDFHLDLDLGCFPIIDPEAIFVFLRSIEIVQIIVLISIAISIPLLILFSVNPPKEHYIPEIEDREKTIKILEEEREKINNAHSEAGDRDDTQLEEKLGKELEIIDQEIDKQKKELTELHERIEHQEEEKRQGRG